jgi:hypothetical protein
MMPSFIVTITANETTVQALGQLPGNDLLRRALHQAELRYVCDIVNAPEDRNDVVQLVGGRVLGWLPIASAAPDLGQRIIAGRFDDAGAMTGLPFITYHLSHLGLWHGDPTHWHPRPVPPDFVSWRMPPSYDLSILLKHPEAVRLLAATVKPEDQGE